MSIIAGMLVALAGIFIMTLAAVKINSNLSVFAMVFGLIVFMLGLIKFTTAFMR